MTTLPIKMRLDPDPRAPAVARRVLRGELEGVVDPEVLERTVLLLSEVVTNSVRHAGLGPGEGIGVTVSATGRGLRVEVIESGSGFDVQEIAARPPETGAGGWGLYLVDRLSSAWGVSGGSQTRVWFEVVRGPRGPGQGNGAGPGE